MTSATNACPTPCFRQDGSTNTFTTRARTADRPPRVGPQRQVSSFVWWDDEPPYWRSKKVLRVGVTRAKVHTPILQHIFPACPIMAEHNL